MKNSESSAQVDAVRRDELLERLARVVVRGRRRRARPTRAMRPDRELAGWQPP